jgi:3-mercaptopyruvate sulfurtransferase SseA
MKVWLTVVGLGFALILGVPAAHAQDTGSDFSAPMPPQKIQSITPDDLNQKIQNKDTDFVLVDTEPPDEYAEDHLDGAINYPWVDGVTKIKQFPIPFPRGKMLILYGIPNDTHDLAVTLASYGYTNVRLVAVQGWYKWKNLAYPARPAPAAPPATSPAASPQTSAPASDPAPAASAK